MTIRAFRSLPARLRAQPINPASITGLDINDYKQPASYQWSVGVQRALNAKTVLSVSYVGNLGRHQNDYTTNSNLVPESSLAGILTPVIESGLRPRRIRRLRV